MFTIFCYTVIPIDMVAAEAEIPLPTLPGVWSLMQTEKKGLFLVCTWGGNPE